MGTFKDRLSNRQVTPAQMAETLDIAGVDWVWEIWGTKIPWLWCNNGNEVCVLPWIKKIRLRPRDLVGDPRLGRHATTLEAIDAKIDKQLKAIEEAWSEIERLGQDEWKVLKSAPLHLWFKGTDFDGRADLNVINAGPPKPMLMVDKGKGDVVLAFGWSHP
ncbi:MAG: hypothetical protein ACREN5_04105 [Gemmatimonadales bacterium]